MKGPRRKKGKGKTKIYTKQILTPPEEGRGEGEERGKRGEIRIVSRGIANHKKEGGGGREKRGWLDLSTRQKTSWWKYS